MIKRGRARASSSAPMAWCSPNAHVVADASEVNVRLTDRREFRAKVVASTNPPTSPCSRSTRATCPPCASATRSHARERRVLAIARRSGFENSVTAGIVSAKSRSLPTKATWPFIQTTSDQPGNSGGPLFNLAGEVIGINSQIYSQRRRLSRPVLRHSHRRRHEGAGPDPRARRCAAAARLTSRNSIWGLPIRFGLAKPQARW